MERDVSPKWIPALLAAWIGPILRFLRHHLRELAMWLDWWLITANSGTRVLFLDDNRGNQLRRGVMYVTNNPDPHALYVSYIGRNLLTGCTTTNGTFLLTTDKHVRWTYGWCRDSAKALLVADALR